MKRRLPLGFHDLEEELDDEELEDEDGNPKYRLGYVPPKTREMHKQVIICAKKIMFLKHVTTEIPSS